MTSYENLSAEQKLRATIHRDTRNIANETCHFLGLEVDKQASEIIAEMVFKKVSVYGKDLEAFAKHAKRQTINSEDVKLLARRNPSLLSHLSKLMPASSVTPKEKRRKTIALPVAKQPETPTASTFKEREKENSSPNLPEDTSKCDDLDKVLLDTTIDLTFD